MGQVIKVFNHHQMIK